MKTKTTFIDFRSNLPIYFVNICADSLENTNSLSVYALNSKANWDSCKNVKSR